MDAPLQLLASVGGPASGWLLASVAVWFLLTGRLVTRATYQDARAEARDWRTAYELERQARQLEREARETVTVPAAELQRQVLRSLPTRGEADG